MHNLSWNSTLDAARAAEIFRTSREAVVVTHAKPDGDAIGSTLAIARTLKTLGVRTRCVYVGPMPRWAKGVIGDTPMEVLEPSPVATVQLELEPDLIVIADTGTWSQVAELRGFIEPRLDRVLVIDHHVRGDVDLAQRRFLNVKAASCTQILSGLCAMVLGVPISRLPIDVATALYLGLATDTGWFRFSNVTAETLRTAADLIEAGVDHTALYAMIEQQDSVTRFHLLARALDSLSLHRLPIEPGEAAPTHVALMRLTEKDFEQTGATRNDAGGFSDMLLGVAEIKAAAVLSEQMENKQLVVKVSMRSKPGLHALDVNAAMSKLGGGGHVRAAGARIPGSLEHAEELVLKALNAAS